MGTILQDLRYALRLLRKSPVFTVIAAVTVSLGIGATATIFSVVNSVLFKPAPGIREPGEIVRVQRVAEDGSSDNNHSYANYLAYRDGDTGLEDLAALAMMHVAVTGAEESEAVFSGFVSHEFFRVMGVRPALGRFFTFEEDQPSDPRLVVVLSHGTWMRRYGGDPSVLGRTITLNGRPFTVIGVTEEGFRGPVAVLELGFWLPLPAALMVRRSIDLESRADTWIDAMGRRAPGVTTERVSAAMNVISANLRSEFPEGNPDYGVSVEAYAPISRRAFGAGLAFSMLLFVVSGTVLLIACLNVGSMLLARVSKRSKEMAMRLALGAGRMRVIRQLLIENIVLFSLGGVGGVIIAVYVTRLLSSFQLPFDVPLVLDFTPDMRVLVFALVIAGLTGMIFGLAPALQVTRQNLHSTLKQEHGTGMGRRSRLRSTFVVAQVAGSALLLIGAGLFARGLARAHAVDLGFEPDNVHALSTELEFFGYDQESAPRFYEDLSERAARLPGVESVALIDFPPVTIGGYDTEYTLGGGEIAAESERPRTDLSRVTGAYFETFGIPLLQGRSFSDADRGGSTPVAIVNETFADRNWPGEDPVGKRVSLGSLNDAEVEVIGVARSAKYRSLTETPRSMVYVPYAQWPTTSMILLARVGPGATAVAGPLREIVHDIDPVVGIDASVAYRDFMGIALLPGRAAALFSTVFGFVGLLMASLGLYGVLAYTVAQRTREIGIRIALGAAPQRVRIFVLQDGLKLAGVGLAIGFVIAFAVTRLLRGLLYGLSPMDPVTFGGIGLVLLVVAVMASFVPALRATRVSPVDALRSE
jgi:predicted permease